MRKKKFHFSTPDLLNSAYPLSFLLSFACSFLDCTQARGDSKDVPGLPIARLILPSLPINAEIVSSTGTYVGGKVNEFNILIRETEERVTLIVQSTRELYENAIAEVSQYHLIVSEIEAKLQLGTTPGNPLLIALYDAAHGKLNQIINTIGRMDGLAQKFRQSSNQMNILSEHIKATLFIPGALDEDHAHLILMSETLTKVQYVITQVLEVLNANEKRQTEWLIGERTRFSNLSLAIDTGKIVTPGSTPPYPALEVLPELNPSKRRVALLTTNKEKVKEPVVEPVTVVPIAEPINIIKPVAPPLLPLDQSLQEEIKEEVIAPALPIAPVETPNLEVEILPQEEDAIPEPIVSQEEPLPLVNVAPRPETLSIPEEIAPLAEEVLPPSPSQELPLFSSVLKGRAPLGVIDNQQDLQAQKWYIFSTANRGLNSPTSSVEIVNIIGNNSSATRGNDVKKLLVEMGLNPSQLHVISAKSENGQEGQIVLLGK